MTELKMDNRQAKQVIVFRKDLLKGEHAIRKGKFAGQCAHASLGAFLQCAKKTEIMESTEDNSVYTQVGHEYNISFMNESYLDKWLNGIFTKIVLYVENDAELVELYERIKNNAPHIPCVLITDRGNTEFHGVPTNTCIGIGPFWSDEIDEFTKNLKLL